jgi:hypothetical protein
LQRGKIATNGPLKMLVRDLQVVLLRDRLRVADPLADNMHRKALCQFCFPCAPQILKQFWPRIQSSPFDDPQQLGSQIRVCAPITGDDKLRTRFC